MWKIILIALFSIIVFSVVKILFSVSLVKTETKYSDLTITKLTPRTIFATEYIINTTDNHTICVKLFPEFNLGLKEGTKSVILKNGNFIYYNFFGIPIELEKCENFNSFKK